MKIAGLFKNKSFLGPFVSQVTGSFNDNALKTILVVVAASPMNRHNSFPALLWSSNVLDIFPSGVLLALGFFSLIVCGYIFHLFPESVLKSCVGGLTHTFYRIKAVNLDRIPESGAVLLTPNHTSFVDGLIVYFSVPHRRVRFLVDREFFEVPLVGWGLKTVGCIPVSADRAKDAILQAIEALNRGELVCVFPEGSITRSGVLLPFKKGVELILRKAPADTIVLPVCIDKIWGSVFSFKGNKFFWKIPESLPYPVSVVFGKPVGKNISAFALRQKVAELISEAFSMREFDTLPARFIETAKRRMFKKAVADTTKKPLTYLRLLSESILLSKQIKKMGKEKEMVGLMLPASVAGVISNIAVGLSRKVAVNLDFAAGSDALEKAIARCEMKTILTSKRFIEKNALTERKQFVYIEDMARDIGLIDKVVVSLSVLLLPAALLKRFYYTKEVSPDKIATVIFSGGSSGDPKGVMLSHFNLNANVEMVNQLLRLGPDDRVLGSLPFFLSSGYTLTLWLPLLQGLFTAYAPDPLAADTVGNMAQEYKTTIMLGAPTFYALYVRKCAKEQISGLRLAVAGGKPLPQKTADAFAEKFGAPLVGGYGTSEMSPVISCNVPDYRDADVFQQGTKKRSAGRLLPGLSAKVVCPDNYDLELPHGEEGMLLVNGPNKMLGYLKDKERTEAVMHRQWYVTGDVAKMDEEGFIYLLSPR